MCASSARRVALGFWRMRWSSWAKSLSLIMFAGHTDVVSCCVLKELKSGELLSWTNLVTRRDREWKIACSINPTSGSISCSDCTRLFQTSSLFTEMSGNGVNSPSRNAFVSWASCSHDSKNDRRFEQIFGTSFMWVLDSRALQNGAVTSLSIKPNALQPAMLNTSCTSERTDLSNLFGVPNTPVRNSAIRFLRK